MEVPTVVLVVLEKDMEMVEVVLLAVVLEVVVL